ncbi:NAD(P)-dependent dehydrogenase, short-chain alcohol dehydrogenase family [Bifidobacterium bohemicum]|uniref:3-alpha-(Or 20-beta)-hydroxysteroid dehydrogenase n=1 Tax=Bifidobacterium bohemicum DSM 22767 TaxID=1437606 RepID=A0A086ZF04_9BIFI|nr:glucose 1-dehydrogenase [Bifidobacterium bohemicum]KFI45104.1 3-alpha-(or 20-beta)-hydroxysteroid dehydrogenase [Bifidobacterium bohemicum DSM 22767]SCB91482.1 NAD(P)-dependent dehydrogenase, short-chain alcohol dehydrogenase family [Bifidobacterium bohemicum]
MANRLDGKVALITGASSGIGLAIAKKFVTEGAKVVLGDINDENGEKAAQEIGENALYIHLDVSNEDEWIKAYEATIAKFGKVNVVVNNAGIAIGTNIETVPLDIWNKTIAINGTGVMLGTKYGVQNMKNFGGGSIINMSSIEGLVGESINLAYNFTKGGVRLMTKSAALYCAEHKMNIRVNTIHPGYIHTPMVDTHPDLVKLEESKTPMGHLGEADDIANLAVFLASDESKFSTGSEFVADGGYTAQ